jgi:hypothetical protein
VSSEVSFLLCLLQISRTVLKQQEKTDTKFFFFLNCVRVLSNSCMSEFRHKIRFLNEIAFSHAIKQCFIRLEQHKHVTGT